MGRVVILIDEYDKPLIDHLHNQEVAEGNRQPPTGLSSECLKILTNTSSLLL